MNMDDYNPGLSLSPAVSDRRLDIGPVCTECRKQKQKCDRQQPCSNCVRRHIPDTCTKSAGGRTRASLPRTRPKHVGSTATAPAESAPRAARSSVPANVLPSPTSQNSMGHLWNSRGAPSFHGGSYFGLQAAAVAMQVDSPDLPVGLGGIHAGRSIGTAGSLPRNEKGPYSQIWELMGYLPRQKTVVDHFTRIFLDVLNPTIDAVHEESFMVNYNKFWDRRWSYDDLTTVDLRWLSLLFIVLAFGELLNCPESPSPEVQRDCEESSLTFYWASRKCVVVAPTFSGESPDIVRAGILISRYLLHLGRKSESWLTASFAVRMAQAQGMHIDGDSWNLPRKVSETRRRIWSHLFTLDRTLSLSLGRPYTINDKHCMEMKITNIWVDDLTAEEAQLAQPLPIEVPTPSIYNLYQQQLAAILGRILDECFTTHISITSFSTYDKVQQLDRALLAWKESLPPYFRLEDADTSKDSSHAYLYWHRLYLSSSFHFARITLHRPYVLLRSITDRFEYSRDACLSSAYADLKVKLNFSSLQMGDRLRFNASGSNILNSALVLAVLTVHDPFSGRTEAIIEDLQVYCEKQHADRWANALGLAEVKIVELCIASVKRSRREGRPAQSSRQMQPAGSRTPVREDTGYGDLSQAQMGFDGSLYESSEMQDGFGGFNTGFGEPFAGDGWLDTWVGYNRTLPEPLDYEVWEGLVRGLEMRR